MKRKKQSLCAYAAPQVPHHIQTVTVVSSVSFHSQGGFYTDAKLMGVRLTGECESCADATSAIRIGLDRFGSQRLRTKHCELSTRDWHRNGGGCANGLRDLKWSLVGRKGMRQLVLRTIGRSRSVSVSGRAGPDRRQTWPPATCATALLQSLCCFLRGNRTSPVTAQKCECFFLRQLTHYRS